MSLQSPWVHTWALGSEPHGWGRPGTRAGRWPGKSPGKQTGAVVPHAAEKVCHTARAPGQRIPDSPPSPQSPVCAVPLLINFSESRTFQSHKSSFLWSQKNSPNLFFKLHRPPLSKLPAVNIEYFTLVLTISIKTKRTMASGPRQAAGLWEGEQFPTNQVSRNQQVHEGPGTS